MPYFDPEGRSYDTLWERDDAEGNFAEGNRVIRPQCSDCVFWNPERDNCEAFPEGIPLSIKLNEYDHRRIYPKQPGRATWKPRTPGRDHPMRGGPEERGF